MKLATHRDGSRDGVLHIVSRDLSRMVPATGIAPTMQTAIESWDHVAPLLDERYAHLNDGVVAAEVVDPRHLESPLPRAYQFLDGSAYLNHVELVRRARGAEMPPSFLEDPLMYQAVSDGFLGPYDDIMVADEAFGIDMEAEVTVVLDDVPMGIAPADAGAHIRLVMLVNDVSLRGLIPAELAKGFGFLAGKPRSAFSPVAVTPDELGSAWDGGKANLPLIVHINDTLLGRPNAGMDMNFDFPRLIAHAAQTRAAGRRHDRRLGHGLKQGPLNGRLLPGRDPHDRDPRRGQAAHRVHALRRPRPYRDAGRRRGHDLRRHRTDRRRLRRAVVPGIAHRRFTPHPSPPPQGGREFRSHGKPWA